MASVSATCGDFPNTFTSVTAYRSRLLLGTTNGAVVPSLWSGEIVAEKQINVLKRLDLEETTESIVQLSCGFDQRVGFVSKCGSCGLLRYDYSEEQVVLVAKEACTAIALCSLRNLIAVSQMTSKHEEIVLYTFSYQDNQVRPLRTFQLCGNTYPRSTMVEKLSFCNDSRIGCLAVSHKGFGISVWSLSGKNLVSTTPEVGGSRSLVSLS